MADPDPFKIAILRGAVVALRRRAERQAKISEQGTTIGERGVIFRTGEGVLASRLATVLTLLADDLERGGLS
jgi:hypothetical protein